MYNIKDKLKSVNSEGFTIALKGETKRYVIGLTHNKANVTYKKLEEQAENYKTINNINVGWWVDSETNKKYIDVSTSSDDLSFAKRLAKFYNQIAIYDLISGCEIRI